MSTKRGNRIRRIRESQGLTSAELGDRCGVSSGYIRMIELGNRTGTIEVLEKISAALGVDVTAVELTASGVSSLRSPSRPDELLAVCPLAIPTARKMGEQAAADWFPAAVARGGPVPLFRALTVPSFSESFTLAVEEIPHETLVSVEAEGLRLTVRPDVLGGAQNAAPGDRFTLAHAFAHIVLHADQLKAAGGLVFRDRSSSPAAQLEAAGVDSVADLADAQANAWAAGFLIPTAAARAHLVYSAETGADTPIAALAGHFQVLPEALEHRLGALLPDLVSNS